MPTYDFECSKCNRKFSTEHGMNDPHPDSCPICGGDLWHKFYTQNVIYKRAGFRATDKRLEIHPDDYDPDVD